MPARPEREPEPETERDTDADAEDTTDALRDLGELWRFGLETSRAMAERVVDLYRDVPVGPRGAGADPDTELRRLRIDLERALDLSIDVFDRVLALASRIEPRPGDGGGADAGPLVVRGRPGDRAHGTLWIHNRADRDEPAPALRCTDLTTFAGAVIPARHVRVDLADEPIAAWNSRAAELVVTVPEATPPGAYVGLVIAADDADLSFRVRVDVSDVVVDLPHPADRA